MGCLESLISLATIRPGCSNREFVADSESPTRLIVDGEGSNSRQRSLDAAGDNSGAS
jgi:hypothetical protein